MSSPWRNRSDLQLKKRCLAALCIFFTSTAAVSADHDSFWDPSREATAALVDLQRLSVHAEWLAWWRHLEGDRLAAMARKESAVDPRFLWKTCQRLEHPVARSEPEFYALHEALLDWRVELELPKVQSLPASIRLVADDERPTTADDLRGLLQAARLAAARTSFSLRGEHAAAWRTYLMLPALTTLPQAESAELMSTVRTAYARTSAGYIGLDRRGIVALRSALGRLLAGLESLPTADSRAVHRERMLALAAALEAIDRGRDPAAERIVSSTVNWLEQSVKRRPFAYAVRRRYTWPNVYLHVPADFVRKHSVRTFERTDPVRDRIQGVSIQGNRTARGQTWLELAPHPTKLSFDLLLNGAFVASTVGMAQRARVYSDTTGAFTARKRVSFDGMELLATPSTTTVRQNSRIRCITVDVIRLFQRFAMRRAWAEASARRSTVEGISRQHTEAQVRAEFDRNGSQELERLRTAFRERLWAPLQRYNQLPRLTRIATTERGIEIRALMTDLETACAFAPPPETWNGNSFTLRIHESAIAHGSRALADDSWSQAVLGELARDFVGANEGVSRTVAFGGATTHRLSVKCAGNEVQVSFQLDGRDGSNLQATVVYDVTNLASGGRLVRRGGVALEPIEVQLDGREAPLVSAVLRNRLTQVLPAVIEPQRPAWWGRGNVALSRVDADHGWLTLTWEGAGAPSER